MDCIGRESVVTNESDQTRLQSTTLIVRKTQTFSSAMFSVLSNKVDMLVIGLEEEGMLETERGEDEYQLLMFVAVSN